MSPATRLLWRRIQDRVRYASPDVRTAILRSVKTLAEQLSEEEMVRLLRSQAVDQLIADLLSDASLDRAFATAHAVIGRTVQEAGASLVRTLPKAARVGFDTLNPAILTALDTLRTRVMTTLKAEVRETVRQAARAGLAAGQAPRTIARQLRAVLGLAPNQEAAVRNFRDLLESGDREALSRALRDRRFDATLRRALGPDGAGLSAGQVTRMTDAYRQRMEAHNAATHARTITLDAQKAGQKAVWDDAIARGIVDGDRLMKRWSQIQRPTRRLEHVPLHGEVVRHDQVYSNGQMIPGETDWNCGCVSFYFLARRAA